MKREDLVRQTLDKARREGILSTLEAVLAQRTATPLCCEGAAAAAGAAASFDSGCWSDSSSASVGVTLSPVDSLMDVSFVERW